MGTKKKKSLDMKGVPVNLMFSDSLNSFALSIIMGTLIFEYGYNLELYY